MDLIDLVIIILFIAMIVRGAEIGFIRQIFATIGFVGGLLLGAALTPHFVKHISNPESKSIWTLIITIGAGLIFLSVGEYIGVVLKRRAARFKVGRADAIFGSVLGVLTLLAGVWLAASILIKLPFQGLQSEIQQSAIVGELNKQLPSAPNVVASLGHFIEPNGFPQVFIGTEPIPSAPVRLPTASAFQTVVNRDAVSVVKVEGLGCGGIVEGSGFIASPGLVITNAHVVAGVSQPYVIDQAGRHTATAIWFDPNLDLAVLRTTGLAGQPLSLDSSIEPRGTQGVVMGYPGGGPLAADPAAVLDEFEATGRNIYNEGNTDRNIYELQANVIPGNSGGPIINSQGNVFGIVFAQSTVYNHVGYALVMQAVVSEFNQAKAQNQATGTGSCAE